MRFFIQFAQQIIITDKLQLAVVDLIVGLILFEKFFIFQLLAYLSSSKLIKGWLLFFGFEDINFSSISFIQRWAD